MTSFQAKEKFGCTYQIPMAYLLLALFSLGRSYHPYILLSLYSFLITIVVRDDLNFNAFVLLLFRPTGCPLDFVALLFHGHPSRLRLSWSISGV